jgi:hypothetical protein
MWLFKVACGSLHLPRRKPSVAPSVREDLRAFRRRFCPGIGFTEERTAFTKSRTYLISTTKRSGNRPVEEENWRIGRSLPENLPHGRPAGSEVFLHTPAKFNTDLLYSKNMN